MRMRLKVSWLGRAFQDSMLTSGNGPQVPGRRPGGSDADVKQLTEEDLPNYTIFDVILPLAGWNVEYPGGACGEMYEKILKADGLDPKRMKRDQRCVPAGPRVID